MFIGRVVDPSPSIKELPLGQDGQSSMQTSPDNLDLINGIDVSKAVSKMARVGTKVRVFKFACAGVAIIEIETEIRPTAISFFIRLILLNKVLLVNSF
jgi:hypothetical protein